MSRSDLKRYSSSACGSVLNRKRKIRRVACAVEVYDGYLHYALYIAWEVLDRLNLKCFEIINKVLLGECMVSLSYPNNGDMNVTLHVNLRIY